MSDKKVAVVTGSAAGLGKAIATRLAQDGFAVVLHDINADNLAKVKAEFDQKGWQNIAVQATLPTAPTNFALPKKPLKRSDAWMCG